MRARMQLIKIRLIAADFSIYAVKNSEGKIHIILIGHICLFKLLFGNFDLLYNGVPRGRGSGPPRATQEEAGKNLHTRKQENSRCISL